MFWWLLEILVCRSVLPELRCATGGCSFSDDDSASGRDDVATMIAASVGGGVPHPASLEISGSCGLINTGRSIVEHKQHIRKRDRIRTGGESATSYKADTVKWYIDRASDSDKIVCLVRRARKERNRLLLRQHAAEPGNSSRTRGVSKDEVTVWQKGVVTMIPWPCPPSCATRSRNKNKWPRPTD